MREGVISEPAALRLGYMISGSFCLYQGFQTWVRGRIDVNPYVVAPILLMYILSFLLLALAFLDETSLQRFRHSTVIAMMIVTVLSGYVISHILYKGAYRTDALAFTHYSAQLLLDGQNPYVVDLDPAFTMFAVDPSYITLTPGMDVATNLAYPALHFLYFTPFVAAGVQDMRLVLFLFEMLAIALIYRRAPSAFKPLILAPIFINADLAIDFNAGSVTDALWVLPMVAMIFMLKDPVKSGILYGVACATKQQPWILAPFILVWIYNAKSGSYILKMSNLMRFIAAAVVAFVVPNMPFMAMNFHAWFAGILSPISGNLVILSQGLSMLTQADLVPLPPFFYLATSAAVFATLLANYVVYFDRLKHMVWIFPAIAMWFSYRALQNYFMYWIPVAVAGYLCWMEEKEDHAG